ncbi:MAG: DUF6231 family protein [Pseudomonadota bacterium]|nr:DUF6231 family protein [Pseudomonadota bacterium]
MHTVHHDDLRTLLDACRPASVLLLDAGPGGLPGDWSAAHPDCRVTHLDAGNLPARLESLERFDLGVVANTLEHLDRRAAGRVLARLRDLQTRRFVALLPIGPAWQGQRSHWEIADLLAYGMTLLRRYRTDAGPLILFHYAIETYKSTPEWFNARHWAHPQNWRP